MQNYKNYKEVSAKYYGSGKPVFTFLVSDESAYLEAKEYLEINKITSTLDIENVLLQMFNKDNKCLDYVNIKNVIKMLENDGTLCKKYVLFNENNPMEYIELNNEEELDKIDGTSIDDFSATEYYVEKDMFKTKWYINRGDINGKI